MAEATTKEGITPHTVSAEGNHEAAPRPGSSHSLRHQELDKTFNLWATLGVAFSFQITPLILGAFLVISLVAGGSPYFVYSFVVAFAMNMFVAASLAEMAGFLPHVSGQVYWTAWAAPRRWARRLSYAAGCLTLVAWVFTLSFVCLLWAQLLLALCLMCGATFEITTWHQFLLYEFLALVCILTNTNFYRTLSGLAKFALFFSNAGALFIAIALLARSRDNFATASQVFVEVVNETGWSSKGLVFFLSMLPGLTAINAFDAASHLTEEMTDPKRQVPQVMIGTALICGFTGLPMILVYMFCNTNPMALLQPIGGQPIFQLFVDAYRSLPLAVLSGLVYLIILPISATMLLLTTSRVWWAFAQLGAFSHQEWHCRIGARSRIPDNAAWAVTVVNALIGLLIFGPPALLRNILGSSIVCGLLSFFLPITCFLFRGRGDLTEKRYFNLGRVGWVVNLIASAWILVSDFFIIFPTEYPVTADNMNYSIVVVAGVSSLWWINWVLYARKTYTAPTATSGVMNLQLVGSLSDSAGDQNPK